MVDRNLIREARNRVKYGDQTICERFLKSLKEKQKANILKEGSDEQQI